MKAMTVPPVNIAEQQMKEKCKNCGLAHPPLECPAYGDTCRACGKKNHWKMCVAANTATTIDGTKKTVENSVVKRRKNQETLTNSGTVTLKTHSTDSDEQFHCVQIFVLSRTMRKEAFTNLHFRLPQKKGKHKLKLKIDSGAAGNTLPVRTIRQMYGDKYKYVF